MEKHEKWVMRWRSMIASKPSKPGVWRRKEGGWLVRGRAMDPRTGKMKEVRFTVIEGDALEAFGQLQSELKKVRLGIVEMAATKMRFNDFAVSLLARKINNGEIKSAKSREHWGNVLEHHLFPTLGSLFVDQIRRADIEAWKANAAARVKAGTLSPVTVNGWLAVLRVVINTAVGEHELERNPVAAVKPLDTSTHVTYSEEQPNALTSEELKVFLAEMLKRWPQFFAMTALGFATGLRPSSLRPLRRTGPTPDILWESGVLLVRRSHTRKKEVMETTKTKRHLRISLPPDLVEILRWHEQRLPERLKERTDLLFPSVRAGFHAPSALDKPFRDVAEKIGLTKRVSPRAMRRTFQDLARAAEVKDVVTRAISGHATEDMQRHYSTVQQDEIRGGLTKVIDLAGYRELATAAAATPNPATEAAAG